MSEPRKQTKAEAEIEALNSERQTIAERRSKLQSELSAINTACLRRMGSVQYREYQARRSELLIELTSLETSYKAVKERLGTLTAKQQSQAIRIPVGSNQTAIIPYPMSEEEYDLILDTMALWKKKLTGAKQKAAKE